MVKCKKEASFVVRHWAGSLTVRFQLVTCILAEFEVYAWRDEKFWHVSLVVAND